MRRAKRRKVSKTQCAWKKTKKKNKKNNHNKRWFSSSEKANWGSNLDYKRGIIA